MESVSSKKYVAELIGTMVLTLVGCGVAVVVGCDTSGGVVATALAFGLSVVAMHTASDACPDATSTPRSL